MLVSKIFRNTNTHRISLPRPIMDALDAVLGDHVVFEHTAPGEVTIRNCTALVKASKQKEPSK